MASLSSSSSVLLVFISHAYPVFLYRSLVSFVSSFPLFFFYLIQIFVSHFQSSHFLIYRFCPTSSHLSVLFFFRFPLFLSLFLMFSERTAFAAGKLQPRFYPLYILFQHRFSNYLRFPHTMNKNDIFEDVGLR